MKQVKQVNMQPRYILVPNNEVTAEMIGLSLSDTKGELKGVWGTHMIIETDHADMAVFNGKPAYPASIASLMSAFASKAEFDASLTS